MSRDLVGSGPARDRGRRRYRCRSRRRTALDGPGRYRCRCVGAVASLPRRAACRSRTAARPCGGRLVAAGLSGGTSSDSRPRPSAALPSSRAWWALAVLGATIALTLVVGAVWGGGVCRFPRAGGDRLGGGVGGPGQRCRPDGARRLGDRVPPLRADPSGWEGHRSGGAASHLHLGAGRSAHCGGGGGHGQGDSPIPGTAGRQGTRHRSGRRGPPRG